MRTTLVFLLSIVLTLAACRQSASLPAISTEDMKAQAETAIRKHLAERQDLAMDRMDLEIQEVRVEGKTAVARVLFKMKSGEGEMPFSYKLQRKDGGWVVDRPLREASQTALPAGHPHAARDPAPAH